MPEKKHGPQAKPRAALVSASVVHLRLSVMAEAKRQVIPSKPAALTTKPKGRMPAGQGPGCGAWWAS